MMEKLGAIENKEVQKYTCLFSDSHHKHGAKKQILKAKRLATNKHKERRNVRRQKHSAITIVANKKHIKNLSNKELTNDQINLLTKGLKLIPTPVTKQTQIRQQLLCDFDQFARRMRLMYTFQGENNNPDPYHVKFAWKPPIQRQLQVDSGQVTALLCKIDTGAKGNVIPVDT